MAERVPGRVLVLSRTWWQDRSEPAFVLRTIAGALSRRRDVFVLAPGEPGPPIPDGLFDVWPAGGHRDPARWPDGAAASWPSLGEVAMVIVDEGDAEALAMARHHAASVAVLAVSADRGGTPPASQPVLEFSRLNTSEIGLPISVNPLAAARPHNGFGFTGYLLVLTDRGARGDSPDPDLRSALPTDAAWLAARFPRRHLVVVQDAVASAWLGRSLRGAIRVDTRTDLWRLMAHAWATVDLRPGTLVARECVESMLFATPVIAPSRSVARRLAQMGGGLWFDNPAQLLGCVEVLGDQEVRGELGRQARSVALRHHGDPSGFPDRVAAATGATTAP